MKLKINVSSGEIPVLVLCPHQPLGVLLAHGYIICNESLGSSFLASFPAVGECLGAYNRARVCTYEL